MTPGLAIDTAFDTARRFVRVTGERSNGFIEFDFAIGDPGIFVELVLPAAAFKEFCSRNEVTMVDGGLPDAEDGAWVWRMSDARSQRDR